MASISNLSICKTGNDYFLNYTLNLASGEKFVSQAATDYVGGLAEKAAVMYKSDSESGGGTLTKTLGIGTSDDSEGRSLRVALLLQGGGVMQRQDVGFENDEC